MQVFDAFPIPVCFTTLGERMRDLNETLVVDVLADINIHPQKRSGVDVTQTTTTMEQRHDSFRELQQYVDEVCNNFIGNIVRGSVSKSSAYWGNVNTDKCAFHMPHSHSFSGYSFTGVYFPTSGTHHGVDQSIDQNLDKGPEITSQSQPSPGSLVLLDPLEFVKSGVAPANAPRYPYFGNPICVTPRESTLIIFPSYLPHMVTPTRKDDFMRMSIAFSVTVT